MKHYYLLLVAIAFIFGIILASFGVIAVIPPILSATFIISLVSMVLVFRKSDSVFLPITLLLVIATGMFHYAAFNKTGSKNIGAHASFSQRKVFVQGKVASYPEEKGGARPGETFKLEAYALKLDDSWEGADGYALVNIYGTQKESYQYGDILVLEGLLGRPYSYGGKNRFNYEQYLAKRRIYSILNVKKDLIVKKLDEEKGPGTQIVRSIYKMRSRFTSHINKYLDKPYNYVLMATLLGKRKKMPLGLRSLFVNTGTMHILAISGLHVGIVYFALKVLLKLFRISRNLGILLSLLALISFAILTGAKSPILRATTMFSILALGEAMNRRIGTFNLIGFSCLIILIANPNQIFDIGFVLSYAAVLSIVSISPIVYEIFSVKSALKRTDPMGRKIRCYLVRSISVSLAAWIGLAPLIAYYFSIISPIVVIANLIVVPLLFMVMGSGILFVTLGFISKHLAVLLSESVWFFIHTLISSVKVLESIPFGHFAVKSPHIAAVPVYYVLLLYCIIIYNRKKEGL
ncbi:MAG: ComEC/Rec2 family competence protein [Candidatus Omnitrophota bacterium]